MHICTVTAVLKVDSRKMCGVKFSENGAGKPQITYI